MELPKGTTVAFGVKELKIFPDGHVKMALLNDENGGFFDSEEEDEEEEEAMSDLCSVEDVQPFVDLDAEGREALRSVILQIAAQSSIIDVLICLFKQTYYSIANEGGASDESKLPLALSEKMKQMVAGKNSANWAKFFALSGFLPANGDNKDFRELIMPRTKTVHFDPTWTLLQAMEELSDEQLRQLDRIDDRLAGPLIFVIRKSLLNQCVEKNEEKAFRLFAKNDRNDKDNNENRGANILRVLGSRLVRSGPEGDVIEGENKGDIIRFDPPKSWEERLELASALKVIYAIFGGEKRVKNFLGTENKSPFLCCIG